MTKVLNALVFWTVFCTAFSAKAFGESDAREPTLVIKLINDAGVSEKILAGAREHVQRIFSHAGIQIGWDQGGGLQLTVVLVSKSMAKKLDPERKLMTGFAVSNDGKGLRRAYVFANRVNEVCWYRLRTAMQNGFYSAKERHAVLQRKTSEGMILGHVIAHEIGHLMLPYGTHSATGIMSAQIDHGELRQALDGSLLFSHDQSQAMRAALR